MGEHKRREAQQTPYEKMLTDLSRKLTDDGLLIEAGWVGLRKMWLHPDSPEHQVAELRKAFMAGAQHLFSSIMTIMDEDREPTDADMRRMSLISKELETFGRELVVDLPTKGECVMADVTGPISSLPGTRHDFPEGTMCDDHPDRPAVVRVQGETDSFGSEMHDLCADCLREFREEVAAYRQSPQRCDWCQQEVIGCRETRDYDEGINGPVYTVCPGCMKRRDDRLRQEEMNRPGYWDYNDEPEDHYVLGEECGRWRNGKLAPLSQCLKAGSEECDWECPYNRKP